MIGRLAGQRRIFDDPTSKVNQSGSRVYENMIDRFTHLEEMCRRMIILRDEADELAFGLQCIGDARFAGRRIEIAQEECKLAARQNMITREIKQATALLKSHLLSLFRFAGYFSVKAAAFAAQRAQVGADHEG